MDAVLLFSGQGAQKVGMGKDLYDQYPVAKALIEQADKALGESLSAVMFEGPGEELTRTCNCQPALYVHGLACLAVLKELVPSLNPVAAAGLSLGEFTDSRFRYGGRCGQGCSRGEGRRLQDCQEAQCGGRLPFPSDAQRYGKAGGRTQEYFLRYAVHACLLQL